MPVEAYIHPVIFTQFGLTLVKNNYHDIIVPKVANRKFRISSM